MIELTPAQNKVAAAGLTVLAISVVLFFVLAIGWAALLFLDFIAPAITPVILGIFVSMLFKPYFEWWRGIVKNPAIAFAAMTATVLAPVVAAVWLCGSMVAEQISALIESAPTILTRLSAWAAETFPNLQSLLSAVGVPEEHLLFFTEPMQFARGLVSQLSSAYGANAMRAGVGVLKHLSSVGTTLLTVVFFAYFITRPPVKGEDFMKLAPFLKARTAQFFKDQINAFLDILVTFFRRQVIICLVEGVMYGTGFALVGLQYGFILGFLLGCLNLVPLLGTITILPVALPIAFFGDGGCGVRLAMVASVWLAGQLLDGYLITPKIQGDKTGLGFAGVIFSFIFWGIIFHSMLGLLLAIPLSAFCVALWRTSKNYIKDLI